MTTALTLKQDLIRIGLSIFLLSTSTISWGKVPQRPDTNSFSSGPALTTATVAARGRLALFSGDVMLFASDTRSVHRGKFGMPIAAGDVVQTRADSRARLELANGDTIHLGPNALLGVSKPGEHSGVNLWEGQLIAYAMPKLEGRNQTLVVHTSEGRAEVKAGKLGIKTGKTATRVSLYDNTARWVDNAENDKHLTAGQVIQIAGDSRQMGVLSQQVEASDGLWVSPEGPAARQGVQAVRGKDLKKSEQILSQVQGSFPYNPAAAYYLGLIQLDQGDLKKAIQQWQRYIRIEPEGERAKEVKRNLTAIISEDLQQEAQQALAKEDQISRLAAEPNSIAVHPLQNKGNERFNKVGKGLTALVISDLTKVPDLKVLERQKVQKLLDEIELSKSGLSDKATAVRASRLLRAEKHVVGDFNIGAAEEK